jgi:hypothetical protein
MLKSTENRFRVCWFAGGAARPSLGRGATWRSQIRVSVLFGGAARLCLCRGATLSMSRRGFESETEN